MIPSPNHLSGRRIVYAATCPPTARQHAGRWGWIATGILLVLAVDLQRALPGNEDPNVIEEFALAPRGMLPVVPVTIEGKEYTFYVDTGSTYNVFDPSIIHLFTRAPEKDVGRPPNQVAVYECRGGTIGSSRIELAPLAVQFDLDYVRRYSKTDIRGLVGMNTLRKMRLQLDFDSGHLRFLKSARNVGGTRLDFAYDAARLPTLEMNIAGAGEVPFLVDTGNCGVEFGDLTEKLFDRLIQSKKFEYQSGVFLDLLFLNQMEPRLGRLSSQTCGILQWKDGLYSEGTVNSVGLGFLSQYVATFNFPNSTLHLAPRDGRAAPRVANESGLQLIDGRHLGLVVAEADPDGLGFAAGIRKGDSILEIDGTPVSELPLISVTNPFRNPSGSCLILFQSQGGHRRTVDLIAHRKKSQG